MKKMTLGVIAALAAIGLIGCDSAEMHRSMSQGWQPSDGFAKPMREKLASDPEGRTFRMAVESEREANWLDADKALWFEFKHSCDDGQSYELVSESPAGSDPTSLQAPHPPSTLFERTLRCAGPMQGEIAVSPGEADSLVLGRVRAALAEDAAADPNRYFVSTSRYSDRELKYQSIGRLLGVRAMAFARQCGSAGFSTHKIVVASRPRPEASEEVFLNSASVWVGTDMTCNASPSVDASN